MKRYRAALGSAVVMNKPSFGSWELADMMVMEFAGLPAEECEIEIIGLCTDICVVSNALILKARLPEVKISVDASCCAGVRPESHAAALQTCRCVRFMCGKSTFLQKENLFYRNFFVRT